MTIADHDIISRRYFFPRIQSVSEATWVEAGGARLSCYHHRRGHALTVIHFHGNGEVVGDYVPGFAQELAQMGADSFFAEYRGYGASTGEPQLGAMLGDVTAIHDAVGVPDAQMVVFGRSVGSIYAIEFAARYPHIAGLVLESGIADVLERVLLRVRPAELGTTLEAMRREFSENFDHRQKLERFQGPALILHAQGDDLVAPRHAEQNAAWLKERAKLVLLPRGDHNSIYHANREAYRAELSAFLGGLSGSLA